MDGHFTLLQIKEEKGVPPVSKVNEISMNHTDLEAIKSTANNVPFENRKPWGWLAEEIMEEDYEDSVVWFCFIFLCDEDLDPKWLVVLYKMHN